MYTIHPMSPNNNRKYTPLEELPFRFTSWLGTTTSILIHTLFFIGIFALRFFDYTLDNILLILTTVVSLEAIYLAIFIQMTINRNTLQLHAVEKDIEEITEDIEDIQEDVEDISEAEVEEREANAKIEKIEEALRTLLKNIEGIKDKS